ncbi:hypothetical protein GCM10017710_41360 [Arthrobacter ramosus]
MQGIQAVDPDGSGVGPQKRGKHEKEGRFARPVGPNERSDLPGWRVEIDVLDGVDRTEAA